MAEFVEVMKQRNRMCLHESMNCYICELKKYAIDRGEDCDTILLRKPQEAEKIIMDWAKEHPVTNRDKFREIFGEGICTVQSNEFWKQEWKDPKEKN